ncbi:unnamed protein product, partial [Cuscuta epithymum]
MFLIFWVNGKKYKLQGVPRKESQGASLNIMAPVEPNLNSDNSDHIYLGSLLNEFDAVFDEPRTLPPFREHYHAINLIPGSQPPNRRPYRYPYFQKNEIERQVEDLLQKGFIRPSYSPFASPVLLVKKQDDSWRMCVDYRALNKITVPDKYPIPNIDELLDELHGATFFSKIDLRSGYHQIRVRTIDIPKTAFRTHSGHYEYVVMPFGLTNAPATFQAAMNDLFRPYLRKFVLVFFDDILVYSQTADLHKQHLRTILQALKHHSYFANLKKCAFGQTRISFLGHRISAQGVETHHEKISAIREWPIPTTVTELRGFLGLAGYYRRFVKNYVQHWRHYLLGRHFTVRTDHNSLKNLMDQQMLTNSQQRLILKLLPFDFNIVYKAGRENVGADSLSRRPQHADFLNMVVPLPMDFLDLEEALLQDPFTAPIITALLQDAQSQPGYSLVQQRLYYNGRLVI